jgi:hypothetical protein
MSRPLRLRRTIKRVRLRTWRALRTYPSLVLTAVVLAIAAAGALGLLQENESRSEPASVPVAAKSAPLQPIDPYVTPLDPFAPQTPTLVMTYYLTDSPVIRDAFNTMKDELRFREWLSKSYFEVILITTPEEEAQARDLIEHESRVPLGAFIVEDLRQK